MASRKPRGQLHELGRGWVKSFMQRMGFVMRKATKTAKKLPPNSEELKESIGVNRPAFGGTVPHFHQMSRVPRNETDVPHF